MRTLNKGMAARYQQENHVTRYPVILYRSVVKTWLSTLEILSPTHASRAPTMQRAVAIPPFWRCKHSHTLSCRLVLNSHFICVSVGRNLWICAIHGLRRSTDCAQHLYSFLVFCFSVITLMHQCHHVC